MTELPVLPRRPRSDYIAAPSRIARRTAAGKRGWFAGWPDACTPASQRTSLNIVRPADGKVFSPQIDKRLAQLFTVWLDSSQEFGYPLIGALEANVQGGKQGGVGSFVCRAIKHSNPPQPSNHSSATAFDLYTRSNPMLINSAGVRFASTIHPLMVELAAAADIYWGGWYFDTSRGTYCDAMHFEYMARPEDVPASLARLNAKVKEIRDRLTPKPPEDDVTPAQVKLLQETLNSLGAQLVVDGSFGPITEAALRALPTRVTEQVKAAESSSAAEVVAKVEDAISEFGAPDE